MRFRLKVASTKDFDGWQFDDVGVPFILFETVKAFFSKKYVSWNRID